MAKQNWMKKAQGGAVMVTAAGLLLAGCGSNDSNATNSTSPTAGASATAASTAPSAAVRGKITATVYDRNNIPPQEGNWDKNRWTEWINKNGPVDVQYVTVPRWESLQKLNTLFASNSAPDLILEYDTGYRNLWYSQKLLAPIDDMVEKYSTTYKDLMKQFPQLKKLGTKDDGKLYEIGKVSRLVSGHAIFIRQDWLDKLKLSTPKTADELFTVAKAFTEQDPDGNGKKDTFGVNLSGNAFSIIGHMFGYGEVAWRVDGNNFIHEWDRLAASVDFQKKLFDAGIVDKDFLADKNGEKAKQDFLSGKLGIYLYQGSLDTSIGEKDYDTLKQNAPDMKLAILPLPSTQYGQFSPVISSPIQMVGIVNAKAKDQKAVMEYIDFMIKPDVSLTVSKGLEGVHWKRNSDGVPETIDAEKNKIEASYTGDLAMMSSTLLWGNTTFKPKNDTQTALLKLSDDANAAYVSKDRPIPTLKPEYLPVLPADLTMVSKNVEQQIKDNWLKAIVSGKSFTAQQALDASKKTWEAAGGVKVDEFYAKWYSANKDTAFMLKDLYEFGAEAEKMLKK
ncbi:extracellular solute-binding protein [Paenibacillus sp. YN15]|uniref:extracellular solute-binding protein n=1 Tax=Paenibacillus sp. YN15 TaxID=1742774 RepID=UPI00215C78CA|nr:extracellular solute-binding protein [Paenibacillus sp. YN15]